MRYEISLWDKLFKKFKRSKWNVDKEIYNKARNKSHRLILQEKKRDYFEKKLKEKLINQRVSGKPLNHLVYP